MRVSNFLTIGVLCAVFPLALGSPLPQESVEPATDVPTAPSNDINEASDQLAALAQAAQETTKEELNSTTLEKRGVCTLGNIRARKEWGSLTKSEKTNYINAALCLQKKAAKTPSILVPGAKTRLDDFVATHINQTQTIHYTANFLSWHRYFIHHYEEALRTECGYKGTQPYWDWAKSAVTGLSKSPIFDGSATSLSGNGAAVPNKGDIVLRGDGATLPDLVLPPGTGGGCLTSGPFKDLQVNLGPVSLPVPGGITESNPEGPFAYNPRCLKRDLTDAINKRFANATSVVRNILLPKDIMTFQMTMQGVPGSGDVGIHGGGHYSMGGDPGRDVSISPGDPAFYLHHANIDRVWWIWQQLKPYERQYTNKAIAGTGTFLNNPPSPETKLDDYVDLGFAAGPPVKIRDLLSITDGPFCYIYL